MKVQRNFQCYFCCLAIITVLIIIVVSVDLVSIKPDNYHELIRVQRVDKNLESEWLPVLTKGAIRSVNSFHKGLAQKFEIIFESGHVCSGKPILPEGWFGTLSFPRVNYEDLVSRQQRGLRRAEWEFQGWSEIVSFHVDRILQFYRKPPIVGRSISSKQLYANDPTWTGLWKRTIPSYKVPIAMLPWVDGLQRGIPSLAVRDFLIGNYSGQAPYKTRVLAGDASDKLVFDFLVDDHDTQGIQNWKADITGKLLHWDSGLGWRDGPYPRSSCFDVLCGTKQWKGIEHHDPNPETCDRICKFRKNTVDKLLAFHQQSDPKQRLSYLLHESLKNDPLYPVVDLSLWKYYEYDKKGARANNPTVFLSVNDFFRGMDVKISKLVGHINECEQRFGAEIYLTE